MFLINNRRWSIGSKNPLLEYKDMTIKKSFLSSVAYRMRSHRTKLSGVRDIFRFPPKVILIDYAL